MKLQIAIVAEEITVVGKMQIAIVKYMHTAIMIYRQIAFVERYTDSNCAMDLPVGTNYLKGEDNR